jgi:hypothetical protein
VRVGVAVFLGVNVRVGVGVFLRVWSGGSAWRSRSSWRQREGRVAVFLRAWEWASKWGSRSPWEGSRIGWKRWGWAVAATRLGRPGGGSNPSRASPLGERNKPGVVLEHQAGLLGELGALPHAHFGGHTAMRDEEPTDRRERKQPTTQGSHVERGPIPGKSQGRPRRLAATTLGAARGCW